ncbi:vWA domain-containing protein [Miltoncostaea oceani]|uniref:vWA domain-containing protein n=1 Tax=Miltoncostaea oceani TaxID=2843216 RepID=UPI001FE925AD|nr:VWA-like domain-containing protein [Miltoncostaea oceani]
MSALAHRVVVMRRPDGLCPDRLLCVVTSNGVLWANPARRAEPQEWAFAISHCLLHLGLGHFREHPDPVAWNLSCCAAADHFQRSVGIGRPPTDAGALVLAGLPRGEDPAYRTLEGRPAPEGFRPDLIFEKSLAYRGRIDWSAAMTQGMRWALESAVRIAGGEDPEVVAAPGSSRNTRSAAEKAKEWFMASYPLLGALGASFRIIEDALVCQRLGIQIAAVDAQEKKIFVNPAAGLNEQEMRFVIAHELLHPGLSHHSRGAGRDPFLWNCACDFVINRWLIELEVGTPPQIGMLHDPDLAGLTSEEIYDRIASDMRRARKLATFAGRGVGDVLNRRPEWWERGDGLDLDAFYRSALAQGLEWHRSSGRGLLPADLVEEVAALAQPPIPWDVELARWMDARFPPPETRRSYARPSRRQASNSQIPRPRVVPLDAPGEGRTFGVVLDTSGSMDKALLARALGTIASYANQREVGLVRVVFCDAQAHDEGYMAPAQIAGRVEIRGRGGTVLQPGVDLLDDLPDFPAGAPVLVITDTYCEPDLRVARDHAFLVPYGSELPFRPQGPVFRMRLPGAQREGRP